MGSSFSSRSTTRIHEGICNQSSCPQTSCQRINAIPDPETRAIERLVQLFLDNPKINSIVPDPLERQIYSNVFRMIITTLQELIHGVRIEVLDHTITLSMTPNDDV